MNIERLQKAISLVQDQWTTDAVIIATDAAIIAAVYEAMEFEYGQGYQQAQADEERAAFRDRMTELSEDRVEPSRDYHRAEGIVEGGSVRDFSDDPELISLWEAEHDLNGRPRD